MSRVTERPNSKPPLHNFSLPPTLKWGNQRLLRCTKPPSCSPRSDPVAGIDTIRENLMHDRRFGADKMRTSTTSIDKDKDDFYDSLQSTRPWNLRTRRAACRAPLSENGKGEKLGSSSPNGRLKREKVRAKFSVVLSKEEIDLDFLTMFGSKAPRRPKKRARISQKQVDFVCPGLWLTEITADRYKVPELRESLKG